MQPQQYGSPQQQYQPQQYAQPAPAAPTRIVDPAGFGGTVPLIRHLEGRAVLCVPTRFEANLVSPYKNPDGSTKHEDRIKFDVLVLDGPPITYGDTISGPQGRTPATHTSEVPAWFTGVVSSHVNIVKPLRDAMGSAVVGRIQQGQGSKGNPPWNLAKLDAGDPMRQRADELFAKKLNGSWVSPAPVDMRPQQAAPMQPAWATQPAAAYPPVQQQYAQQQPAPAQYAPVAQYQQPAQYVPVGAEAPAAPPSDVPPCPPNWDPALWATVPHDQ